MSGLTLEGKVDEVVVDIRIAGKEIYPFIY